MIRPLFGSANLQFRKPVEKVTIASLQQMKRDGKKMVGVVAWDFQIAKIADRIGVEIVSVGDSVGINLWGHGSPLEVTVEEMIIVCKAVRRGTHRAITCAGSRKAENVGPSGVRAI